MLKKFVRFSAVGGLNTLITIGIFYLLFNILHIKYLIASVIGYCIGILNSYIWNKLWTFESKSTAIGSEFSKFVALNLTGLALNALIMSVLVEILNIIPFLAQVITIGIIFILNFFGSSYWVFKDSRSLIKS